MNFGSTFFHWLCRNPEEFKKRKKIDFTLLLFCDSFRLFILFYSFFNRICMLIITTLYFYRGLN
jgi:hypothetical protein